MAPTVDDLRQSLAALSLDTRGHKDVLQKRLARAKRIRAKMTDAETAVKTSSSETGANPRRRRPQGELYDSFLCFDVEATCERMDNVQGRAAFSYPNEIIEFPVLLLQWRTDREHEAAESDSEQKAVELDAPNAWKLEVVDEFHSFVRPTWRPTLSAFCTDLTGITQVDKAPTYPEMLKTFNKTFIKKHGLFTRENKTVWVCDGPWDIRDFISKASFLSRTRRPDWLAGQFIDLRLLSSSLFGAKSRASEDAPEDSPEDEVTLIDSPVEDSSTSNDHQIATNEPHLPSLTDISSDIIDRRVNGQSASTLTAPTSLSLPSVLMALELEPFIGRLHSGLDDAQNAARILIELQRREMPLLPNRCVPPGKERWYSWMGKRGEVRWTMPAEQV